MKKLIVVFLALALGAMMLMAQQPPAGAGRGGGGGGPQRAPAPQVPPATGPLLDMANKISEAVNKQDAASLTKLLADGAVYLDEDGHAPAISRWVMMLTTGTPAKTFTISQTHGGMLDDNAAWLSFNYSLAENYKEMPKTFKGTASLVLKKNGGNWQIVMVHGALEQKVANEP